MSSTKADLNDHLGVPSDAPDDKEAWQQRTAAKRRERDERFTTVSDAPIDELYTAEDLPVDASAYPIGFPGEYPYTRGIHPNMYRGRLWTMRMFAGFGTSEDTNKRYHYLLKQGGTGLSVAFDFPTLYGRDSDDPRARGEVGRCGVAIDTLHDMETLFDGIRLDQVSTSMTINPPAIILLAMYIAVAEKQGVSPEKLRGTVQNDMLKEFIAQKTWIFPPEPSVKLSTDIIEYCTHHLPQWNTVSVSGYHIREAGSTAVQELAFTLADGIGYVQSALDRGLNVDDFAPRISFFFNAHNDFFEEICKYRAARRMWAKIMKERFGAKDPKSWMCRFHTQTAGCSLTAQQPLNNIARTTIQALAAVIGGTQSLHTNSYDETLALPTEESVNVALRTQQIIAEESGAANTVDPLGGSYFVEALTNRMEDEAFEYIRKIDEMGGILKAIETGYPQREISNAAYIYQNQLDRLEKAMVGSNKYVNTDEKLPTDLLKITDEDENRQVARLNRAKANRDGAKSDAALATLVAHAKEDRNLMPAVLECVRAYCTQGEIVAALKTVYGEYHDPAYL
ncbi:MAG: methylmalonyl-CoA mutase family protein [Deltaproteobacteria bacterium]|nr:methylmalonyl-CoA mutase family protein [Deltaproteobacteria bacterium]